jgi:hypothetical protein
MKKFFNGHGLTFEVKTTRKDEDTGEQYSAVEQKGPMYKGSQTALTAVVEDFTRFLFENVRQYTNRDKTGMRTVNITMLKYSIYLHPGLKRYYLPHMDTYTSVKDTIHSNSLPVKEDEVRAVMDDVDRHLDFTPKAFNFFCFLVNTMYNDLLRTSYEFLNFAGKRTLGPRVISAAVRNRFDGSVSGRLLTELSRACAAAGNDIDAVDNDEDESDDEEEEEQTTKAKKGSTTKKASKNSKRTAQIESEDEDEDLDEDLDEDDEELESEEEEEAPPKKKQAAKGKKAAGGKRKARRANK